MAGRYLAPWIPNLGGVALAIILGLLIGNFTGFSKSFSLLLGIGNGICGSSAIAVTAPFLPQDEEEIGLSI